MNKFVLIAGPCAIEDDKMPFIIGREVKKICDDLGIDYIFKVKILDFYLGKSLSLSDISGVVED